MSYVLAILQFKSLQHLHNKVFSMIETWGKQLERDHDIWMDNKTK